MTLLAIELRSLNSAHYIPIIEETIGNGASTSHVRIILLLAPDLRSLLDTAAKRAAHFPALQAFISALYVCCTANVPCDIIFADWCGYAIEQEVWDYSVLYVPQGMFVFDGKLITQSTTT
jgi:hypothetical protein